MRIYAVFDLKGGLVVRAVAGQRDRYPPVRSSLAASARPSDVARGVVEHYGIRDAYVADLDALAGQPPNWRSLEMIAASGMHLLLDAGVRSASQAQALLDRIAWHEALIGLVVPLECARTAEDWPGLVDLLGDQLAVLSLDLHAGRPLIGTAELADRSPLQIAQLAWQAGFRRLIALDLQAVGVGRGPSTLELCRELRAAHRWHELISGGGVRDVRDAQMLVEAGCDGVLVATALHRGDWRAAEGT